MRLKNTSTVPTERLQPLLDFAARGTVTARTSVHAKRDGSGHLHGYCYWGIPSMANVPPGTVCLITLHLPADLCRYPRIWYIHVKRLRAKFPAGFPLDSWQDGVVALAAHEFRHKWQADRRKRAIARTGKRPSGKREYDADLFALRRLNDYRVSTGRPAIPEAKQPNPFARRALEAAA
jgi:hypothetical protein